MDEYERKHGKQNEINKLADELNKKNLIGKIKTLKKKLNSSKKNSTILCRE